MALYRLISCRIVLALAQYLVQIDKDYASDMLENDSVAHRGNVRSKKKDKEITNTICLPGCLRLCARRCQLFEYLRFGPLVERFTVLPHLSCLIIRYLYAGIFDDWHLVAHEGSAKYH